MKNKDMSHRPNGKPMELARAVEILRDLEPASAPEGLEERVFRAAIEQREPALSLDSLFVAAWRMAAVAVVVAVVMVAAASLRSDPEPTSTASNDSLFALASVPELDADTFLATVLDESNGGMR